MPANFGEIATYHQQEAARHYALAQAARDRGSLAEAEYQAGLAARWDEVAQEQKIGMMQAPSRSRSMQGPHSPPQPPPPMPLAVACLLAVERGVKRITAAIRQAITKRHAPVHGLTLR
jgi:hypothetical protein